MLMLSLILVMLNEDRSKATPLRCLMEVVQELHENPSKSSILSRHLSLVDDLVDTAHCSELGCQRHHDRHPCNMASGPGSGALFRSLSNQELHDVKMCWCCRRLEFWCSTAAASSQTREQPDRLWHILPKSSCMCRLDPEFPNDGGC